MSTMLDAGFFDVALHSGLEPAHESGLDALTLVFDELAYGVAVVNPSLRLLHVNRSAREELNRCGVLQVRNGDLQTLSPLDGKTLQTALTKAASGKRSLVKLSASGMDLTLSVVPLRSEVGADCERIALFFARTGICDSGMFIFFARSQGFTPTEEQVLTLLCRGLSTPNIATELKVAVSTVRSHVRSLCIKTGCNGSRELLNRVATLPPVGPLQRLKIH